MELKVVDGAIQINKNTSIPVMMGDRYIFAPADKTIYIVRDSENDGNGSGTDTIITGYNLKGASTGSYIYRNKKVTRLFVTSGYAHIVYCDIEHDGKRCYYQAKLLPVGFCTEIFALHYIDEAGRIIYFDEVMPKRTDDSSSDEDASVNDSSVTA